VAVETTVCTVLGALATTLWAVEVTVWTGDPEPSPELPGWEVEFVLATAPAEPPEPVLVLEVDELGPEAGPELGVWLEGGGEPWVGAGVAERGEVPVRPEVAGVVPPGAAPVRAAVGCGAPPSRAAVRLAAEGAITFAAERPVARGRAAADCAARGVLAIATAWGELVPTPISPSATSAQVAATTAVPSVAAGRGTLTRTVRACLTCCASAPEVLASGSHCPFSSGSGAAALELGSGGPWGAAAEGAHPAGSHCVGRSDASSEGARGALAA
jgi:hypothetical protein